jgi:adenylate kinase family enzyme
VAYYRRLGLLHDVAADKSVEEVTQRVAEIISSTAKQKVW